MNVRYGNWDFVLQQIIPDLDVAPTVDSCPDTQHIFAAPNAQHGATDFVSSLRELITDHGQKQILPVAVRHTLLKTHDPLATPLIGLILPNRTDTLLKDMVVGNSRKKRWALKVRIDCPETLYRGYGSKRDGGLLVVGVFGSRRAVPDDPRRLEEVLTRS